MALLPCPECEQPISSQAPACPHCGYHLIAPPPSKQPNKQQTSMTSIGCAALFVSMLACCGIGEVGSCMSEREQAKKAEEQAAQEEKIQAKRDAVIKDLKEDPQPMVDKAEAAIKADDLPKARRFLDTLDKAGFDTSEHRVIIKQREEERAAERAAKAREERHAEIEAGIAATSDKKTRCDTWQTSWDRMRKLTNDDPPELYKRANAAIKLIARCRASEVKKLEREQVKNRTAARVAYVDLLDRAFLEDNMDVRVKAYSTNKTKLKLTYVFFSNRVWVKKVTDTGMLTEAEKLGFTKVHFDSGFGEGFVYDLDPVPDKERASLTLPDPKPFEIPEPSKEDAAE